jgi:hypothetical protein
MAEKQVEISQAIVSADTIFFVPLLHEYPSERNKSFSSDKITIHLFYL